MGEGELGNKRRLPLWMSPATNSSTKSIANEEKSAGNNINIRKRAKKDETSTDHAVEAKATTIKKKPPKTQRRRRQVNNEEEDEDPMISDSVPTQEDEEDLTVDDLITIANEYVKADVENENHQKPQRLTRRVDASSESGVGSSLTGFTSNDMVDSMEVVPTMGHLSDKTMAVSQDATTTTTKTSGDPAQDMLDLFLGDLLRKPTQTGEAIKQSETAACAAFTEEIALDEYICSQKKQSEEKEDEPLPVNVTKKKSSLRDKVAMFFD